MNSILGLQGEKMHELHDVLERLLCEITSSLEEINSVNDPVIAACFECYQSCRAALDQVLQSLDIAGNRCEQISGTNTSELYAAPPIDFNSTSFFS